MAKRELGGGNGKSLFGPLDMEINSYDEANAEIDGKATLQRFKKDATDSESDELSSPKEKTENKHQREANDSCSVHTPHVSGA